MNLLSVNNLSKSFADRLLFHSVSFGMDKGQKYGLIAQNGAGKTTLLNILMGKILQDEGEFAFREGITIEILDQAPQFEDKHSIRSYIEEGNPRLKLLEAYQEAMINSSSDNDLLTELSDLIDASNAWEEENKINEVLDALNFPDGSKSVKHLSGGEQRRLALAKCLINEPDILFLDEPTNHLDFKMVEWLEKFLVNSPMTLLIITHDRYFLDNVSQKILELSPDGVFTHDGNYEDYLTSKAEREANLSSVIQKAKNNYRTELEWLRRMPKARGTKSKSRIAAALELEKVAKQKTTSQDIEISTKMQRLGKKIIEVKRLNKSYGDRKIITDFNYIFSSGEKIGIVGDNGAGKTTLLNLLALRDTDHTGHISHGDTVSIGYYTQKGIDLPLGKRVIDVVKEIAEVVELKDGSKVTASGLLNQFNFPPKKQHDFVEKLSGGERKRLYLVTILVKAPNFLILDEPTNDLDLITLSVLENYLMNFKGCVLIVSHDRYFLDRIIDHLFVFQPGGYIKDFPGNYTQLRAYQKEKERAEKLEVIQRTENKQPENKTEVTSPPTQGKKLSYKEKLELERIENEILLLEAKIQEFEIKLADPSSLSPEDLQDLSKLYHEQKIKLEDLNLKWIELAD